MTKLTLVRTSKSFYYTAGKIAGNVDTALDNRIVDEDLLVTCSKLKGNHYQQAFYSEFRRSEETIELLKESVSIGKECTNELLDPRDYGAFTGCDQDQLANQFGVTISDHMLNNYDETPPGGEPLIEVYGRMHNWYDHKLLPMLRSDVNVICVLHHDVMFNLLLHLGKVNKEDYKQNYITPGSVVELNYERN